MKSAGSHFFKTTVAKVPAQRLRHSTHREQSQRMELITHNGELHAHHQNFFTKLQPFESLFLTLTFTVLS